MKRLHKLLAIEKLFCEVGNHIFAWNRDGFADEVLSSAIRSCILGAFDREIGAVDLFQGCPHDIGADDVGLSGPSDHLHVVGILDGGILDELLLKRLHDKL